MVCSGFCGRLGCRCGSGSEYNFDHADDVSAKEFSLYGNREINTPQLDRMGEEGIWFQTAWSTPICSPSPAMIMTGLSWNLTEDHLTIGEMMKQAGYKTGFAGKVQMEGEFRAGCGFDGPVERWEKGNHPTGGWYDRAARYWHPSITINGTGLKTVADDYGPDILVNHINGFIVENKTGPGPFFVYYPMLLPHKSWDFERGAAGYLPTPVRDKNGLSTGGKSAPTLKANVEYMVYLVGKIHRKVKELGIVNDTLIIYTADNGTSGYGKGIFNKERGTRVPYVVWGPGAVKPIGASLELIDFSDVFLTLAELAGYTLSPKEGIDGVSFAPILKGDSSRAREWIASYFGPFRQIRTKRWLLDGQNKFFDCSAGRNDSDLKNVTDSNDPEVMAAKKQLQALRDKYLPLDDFRENAGIVELWKKYKKNGGPYIKSFEL